MAQVMIRRSTINLIGLPKSLCEDHEDDCVIRRRTDRWAAPISAGEKVTKVGLPAARARIAPLRRGISGIAVSFRRDQALFAVCQRASASCGFDRTGSMISPCTPVLAVNSTT
jgi:hypothetical protein